MGTGFTIRVATPPDIPAAQAVIAESARRLQSGDYTARRGIGTMLLAACEKAAYDAGFTRFEAGATLTGVNLFSTRGYTILAEVLVPLEEGVAIRVMHMVKG
jgi:hypothetical protein